MNSKHHNAFFPYFCGYTLFGFHSWVALYGKDEVERDFPECSAAAAAGNVTLGICQRKVSARCFLLLLKAAVLVQFFLPPLFSYCVLENSSRLLFPYCPHLLDTSKGTKEEKKGGPPNASVCRSSVPNAYLRLHRTHYGRLDTMKKVFYCLLQTLLLSNYGFRILVGMSTGAQVWWWYAWISLPLVLAL